ncbi:MAG: UDP-3-O-(3-hydroxymyristoyl)glucosamine N-acyltransferase [Candidatus Schekmanbacteria bacterium RBG_13_48_7]|uniref:UDP-3-O-acylglucosamine N-acyltransferase n=1 Tax=Candidatus Schekmanbacteria bacterium RBG_13_48_7 TaxID=1817878 RepID=A0A1F7RJT7_9BACT|nr:MAG: UDP-3-O-(3-hydroxymyristoyl)glucosamine N-acyltransferase [Candidatus Schekmanbacteria bacterium RBG_13_48_7]
MPIAEIAIAAEGELFGNPEIIIRNIAGIKEASEGDLTFLSNPKYISLLESCKASAVIVGKNVEHRNLTLIKTQNPYLGFAKVMKAFFVTPREILGISKEAVIEGETSLGNELSIYPHTFIGRGTRVGDRTTFYPGVYVGRNCSIGSDVILYPNTTIMNDVTIGDRVIIHAGAVIGSDGFGFATDNRIHHKIPQLGSVVIQDDVEIGAGTTIDRATLGNTIIGKGTKIDNLVQIGHNVSIGEGSIIVAQVGISGSVTIGNYVTLGGKVGIVGHIHIEDGVTATAKAGITKSIPKGETVAGFPAKKFRHWLKQMAFLDRGPEFMDLLKELKKRIETIESLLSKRGPENG